MLLAKQGILISGYSTVLCALYFNSKMKNMIFKSLHKKKRNKKTPKLLVNNNCID